MTNTHKILTDEQIDKAWGNANFGESCVKRDLIKNSLLKLACGYMTGSTIRHILSELGLIKKTYTLTKLGKEYLWEAYSNGVSL